MDPWIDKKLDEFFDKNSKDYINMDIFNQIFTKLEEYKDTNPELYDHELLRIRDFKNSFDTAREEGTIKIARNLIEQGVEIGEIIHYTKLSKSEIENLMQEVNLDS
jgi:glutaredoxin-related protein